MRVFALSRQIHKWLAIVALLPLLIIFATGIILSISPKVEWLQPTAPNAPAAELTMSFDRILEAARTVPEAGIQDWSDVSQIDIRPKPGIIRIRAKNYYEIQIDGSSGQVLGAARRWKTLLVLVHDGDWFGSVVRYGIFLPSGITALVLLITGAVLFVFPILAKRRRKKT